MFERRSALLGFIARLVDLGLTALSFPLAYWVRMRVLTRVVAPGVVQPAIYPFADYWRLFIGIMIIWFLIGHFLRIYRDIELRSRQQLVFDAARIIILGLVVLNAALYFVRADYISRAFILTIAAVNIVLHSVVQRLQDLLARDGQDAQLALFKHVRIAKVCNDMDEPVPAGVEVLLADGNSGAPRQAKGEHFDGARIATGFFR